MAYIGNSPEGDAQVNKYEYTATAGQTNFPAVYDQRVDVYLNGVLLSGSDYTATNGTEVVLNTGATLNDIVQIDAFQTIGTPELPDQTGHTDQYLKTNGTTADWADVVGGGPSLGTNSIIRTNAQTISEDITIPSDTNGMSIGDITIADGYTVTVNGRWVVI